jgi:hypothetical protein
MNLRFESAIIVFIAIPYDLKKLKVEAFLHHSESSWLRLPLPCGLPNRSRKNTRMELEPAMGRSRLSSIDSIQCLPSALATSRNARSRRGADLRSVGFAHREPPREKL